MCSIMKFLAFDKRLLIAVAFMLDLYPPYYIIIISYRSTF